MNATARPYFKVEAYHWIAERKVCWRIVSIAGGDTVADSIPSADLAQIMCEAANEARSKKK